MLCNKDSHNYLEADEVIIVNSNVLHEISQTC